MKTPHFNKRTFLIAIFVAATFFTSCKDKETSVENTPMTVQEATLEQKKQALENVTPSTNANGDLAVNPPHGQPGHDCAIPVGAPLNSAASNNSLPTQGIDLNKTNTNSTSTSGGENLNPPHGQPGHRCDIKVGEPL